MMQARMGSFGSLNGGEDPPVRLISQHYRPVPQRCLQFLLLFMGVSIVFSFLSIHASWYIRLPGVIPVVHPRIEPPCVQEPMDFKTWMRPPTTLSHEMKDSELFWRASFVPKIKKYPMKRKAKIAFMFLTRGPLPMAPLWEKFFKGNGKLYSIYIHSFPSYQPEFRPSSVFYNRQIPSQVAEWGMMSMCDAERRLLANALLDISNEWFVLLSEACIPLRNFSIVYQYLARSRLSFIGSFDDPGPSGRGRYHEMMAPLVNITNWRKGSQWFELNRKLAVEVVQDNTYHPIFEQFCKPDCYVDEHYFPTMLSIEFPSLLANRSLTWVDWSRGGAHPASFGKDDITVEFFEELYEGAECTYNGKPTSLCFLFARKFAPSALAPLLNHSAKFFGF
ncbi:glycosyltransferase BC10-like [Primulina eburnea]|uniref:glycosyltransferase BC10-like n=1 Tax=Primulina eburnea TaxID=1245227 RepID=UPI003C6C1098